MGLWCDRRNSQPVVVSDGIMFTALNVTKQAERTDVFPEPRISVPKRGAIAVEEHPRSMQ
jgi:hypothetical protein